MSTPSRGSFRVSVRKLAAVLSAVAAAAVLLAWPGAASASPCSEQVVNDWADNAVVDGHYPTNCYREALASLPEDMQAYSSAPDDIARAMRIELRGAPTSEEPAASTTEPDPSGLFVRALDEIGPRDASSFPLPLLVVGVMVGVLTAAGGLSLALRRLRPRQRRSRSRG
jgi:hypothetical protein